MIMKQAIFQPSVNIRLDMGKQENVERYLPVSSHLIPIKGILKGLIGNGGQAHIVVGPYGSGKSYIGSLLVTVATKSISNQLFESLAKKFADKDQYITNLIETLMNQEITYIPIILEGNVQDFRKSLTSSLYKALKELGLQSIVPGITEEIQSRLLLWKEQYKETYSRFLELLIESNQDTKGWERLIENQDEQAIKWFIEVYPTLTSGAPFIPSFTDGISSQLEVALEELHKRKLGIFVIHDEFGRFLQTLKLEKFNETMQDLQDIAELANKNKFGNLSVLLITHRNLRQYALGYSEELQKEFQRIEGRYSIYPVESDPYTFLRVSYDVTSRMSFEKKLLDDDMVANIRRFNLFFELDYNELQTLVLDGVYPIHPLAMFAMPKLANIVAQNERTLFTFLQSDEVGGLQYHFDKEKNWYTIDHLYDYFEPTYGEFEADSSIKQTYQLFNRLVKRLDPTLHLNDHLKILKLLAILDIASLQTIVSPTTELISFAFMWSKADSEKRLEELAKQKVIRFHMNRWILFEGSFVDLNSAIDAKVRTLKIGSKEKTTLLEEILRKRHYLPKRYNDEKSITRFASVYFVYASDLLNDHINITNLNKQHDSDFSIIHVIGESNDALRILKENIAVYSKQFDEAVFVYLKEPINKIEAYLEQILAIHALENDKDFITKDQFLVDELKHSKSNLKYILNQWLQPFYSFSNDCNWCYLGQKIKISSEWVLSEFLSQQMFEIYGSTPVINNESYNRRIISKVQKKAALQVLDMVLSLDKNSNTELSIDGFGPDYLIYSTVLKNNGINPLQLDQLSEKEILQLREDLLAVLKKGKGQLKELVNIFKDRPYGIRTPVIPLLFSALLAKEWKYILFYNNEMFVSSLDGTIIWEMIESPNQFSFTYQITNENYFELVESIEEVFSSYIVDEDRAHPMPVYVSKTLLRWLQSLPKLLQSTNHQTENENRFRYMIRRGEVQPMELFEELFTLTEKGRDKKVLLSIKQGCEAYLEQHKLEIEYLLQKVFQDRLGTTSFTALFDWASTFTPAEKIKSKLISSISKASEENWVDVLAEGIMGVDRASWSDATTEVFMTEIYNELYLLETPINTDSIEVTFGEEAIIIPNVELSQKSQLIYDNLRRTIQYSGRTVKKDEVVSILWRLLKESTK